MKKNGIHYYKTIIYYFKSNKLIKRINREIKKYFRKYINYEQTDQKT